MKSRTLVPGGFSENQTTSPELVVGVEHRETVARNGFHDNGLDVCQLLEGVDPADPEVVRGDVGDHGDVVAVIAQAFAQDAPAGDLHDREVDARVHQHHPRRLRTRGVRLDDEPFVDDHAVGGGHPHLAAQALEDVGDHPGRRGLAVGAGHRDDRHA